MPKNKPFKSAYGKIGLMLILLFTCFVALRVGSAELTWTQFFYGLMQKAGFETESIIIYTVRLPRIAAALLAGTGLSVSGALLQSVTGNELAAPNIIGVNAGAGFVMIMMLHFATSSMFLKPLGAFLGAFAASAAILFISSKSRFSRSTVILAGVAVTAVLNAGISFMSYFDPDILMDYNHFSVGGVSGVDMNELYIPAVIISCCFIAALLLSDKTDILCLGDSLALSLGVNVKALRLVCLMLASASAAAVVSFAGLLGFVGLVVPHLAKRTTRGSVKDVLTVSPFLGGTLVVAADLMGRTLFSPSEIPVGIVMSFIGAPFLFYIILRRNRNVAV